MDIAADFFAEFSADIERSVEAVTVNSVYSRALGDAQVLRWFLVLVLRSDGFMRGLSPRNCESWTTPTRSKVNRKRESHFHEDSAEFRRITQGSMLLMSDRTAGVCHRFRGCGHTAIAFAQTRRSQWLVGQVDAWRGRER